MSVSPRVRFEVLKRDRFVCAYCGGKAPDVLLHVDHIIPQAAGGSDDIANLITACVNCNQGKGARMLEEGVAPAINAAAIEDSRQRVEQLRQYREWQEQLDREIQANLNVVWQSWTEVFNGTTTRDETGTHWRCELGYPEDRSVRRFIGQIGLGAVLDAVDITAGRYFRQYGPRLYDSNVHRYFFGVCMSKKREMEAAEAALKQARVEAATRFALDFSDHGRRGLTPLSKILDDIVEEVA